MLELNQADEAEKNDDCFNVSPELVLILQKIQFTYLYMLACT